jgi:hypothetical protein
VCGLEIERERGVCVCVLERERERGVCVCVCERENSRSQKNSIPMSNVRKEMETHLYENTVFSICDVKGVLSVCVYERQRETMNKQALLYAYDKTRGHTDTPHTA